ncbi:putative ribonuclease H-like domain-containing protein [Tanacetum coccineum]|uniref:Ribonuclease H-like domain-containing protein n=1 Tax=Tanacetum coccineum TaxID=301880 RepID=A0ABQ5A686_9ASTR
MGQDRHMQMVRGNGGNQFRQYVGKNVGNLHGYNAIQNVENQEWVNVVMQHEAEGSVADSQKEKAGIQLQAEEFDLMAAAGDLDEIEKVNANCILMANLQQASTSDTQTDKAPIYDSDGSAENDSNVISMNSNVEQTDESLAKHKALEYEIERLLRAVVSHDIMSIVQTYNNMQKKIERLQSQLGDLKGKSQDTPCVSDTLDPLSHKLEDENVSLKFQYLLNHALLIRFASPKYVCIVTTRDDLWTKDHPLEQVIREPSRLVLTRNQLRIDGDMCIYALTVAPDKEKLSSETQLVGYGECFIDADHPSHVYKLKKALYGLKQAPMGWYDKLSKILEPHIDYFNNSIKLLHSK